MIIINFLLLLSFIIYQLLKKDENAPIQHTYWSNGNESSLSLDEYYIKILGLTEHNILSAEIITKAYYSILDNAANRRITGEKIYINLRDLRAARNYLIDSCCYLGGEN